MVTLHLRQASKKRGQLLAWPRFLVLCSGAKPKHNQLKSMKLCRVRGIKALGCYPWASTGSWSHAAPCTYSKHWIQPYYSKLHVRWACFQPASVIKVQLSLSSPSSGYSCFRWSHFMQGTNWDLMREMDTSQGRRPKPYLPWTSD